MTSIDCSVQMLQIDSDSQFPIFSSTDCQAADPISRLCDMSYHALSLHAVQLGLQFIFKLYGAFMGGADCGGAFSSTPMWYLLGKLPILSNWSGYWRWRSGVELIGGTVVL